MILNRCIEKRKEKNQVMFNQSGKIVCNSISCNHKLIGKDKFHEANQEQKLKVFSLGKCFQFNHVIKKTKTCELAGLEAE
jgi:hypothetical protein